MNKKKGIVKNCKTIGINADAKNVNEKVNTPKIMSAIAIGIENSETIQEYKGNIPKNIYPPAKIMKNTCQLDNEL